MEVKHRFCSPLGGQAEPMLPAASLNPLGFSPGPWLQDPWTTKQLEVSLSPSRIPTPQKAQPRVSKPWIFLFNNPR